MIHGDLKPEHIMFETDSPTARPKLIDFNFSGIDQKTAEVPKNLKLIYQQKRFQANKGRLPPRDGMDPSHVIDPPSPGTATWFDIREPALQLGCAQSFAPPALNAFALLNCTCASVWTPPRPSKARPKRPSAPLLGSRTAEVARRAGPEEPVGSD